MNNETELALLELEHRYGKEVRDRVEQMGFEIPKHGRWVDATKEIGWPIWECSVCGSDGRGDYFVCPWCGAKMVEGGDAK